jgi:hypothetical protein
MENGIEAKIKDSDHVDRFLACIYANGLSRHLIRRNGETLWIDPKVASLLFHGEAGGLYQYLDLSGNTFPMKSLEWINREGEESYFYKTTDEFITYLGRFSKHYLQGTSKDGYMLAPISSNAIKTVSRKLYKNVVDRHMAVMDIDGNIQETPFDKNIIHFKLMKESEALQVYGELINKKQYAMLEDWIANEHG